MQQHALAAIRKEVLEIQESAETAACPNVVEQNWISVLESHDSGRSEIAPDLAALIYDRYLVPLLEVLSDEMGRRV